MKKEMEFYVIKEGIIGSIITDVVSFSFLLGTLFLNYRYLGNQGIVTWVIVMVWLFTSFSSSQKSYHQFESVKETIEYLENLIKEDDYKD